jgi:uncharacterized protein DUF4262
MLGPTFAGFQNHQVDLMKHDPRCEGLNDEKLISDVKKYGWHVVKILEKDETPGWAFSVGLFRNFNHPEIIVFGLNDEVAHYLINAIGEQVRAGKTVSVDGLYPDLIDTYSCTFKPVNEVWYDDFLGYANWFYGEQNYPVLQCIWPDKRHRFPWDPQFNPAWLWAQPLLFNEEVHSARTAALLQSMAD